MFRSVCLIGAVLVMTAPALAQQSCGSAPLAPAIPGVTEISGKTTDDAHTVVVSAYKSVKTYQASLATFRECVQAAIKVQAAAVDEAKSKGEKAKVEAGTQALQSLKEVNDKTVDTETQVVTDFQNLFSSYCKMGTGLASCPKAK